MALTIKGGTGAPKVVWPGGTLTLPYPQKMNEKFVEKYIEHDLIDHQLRKYVQGYRYSADCQWDFLNEDSDEVGDIIEVLNYLANVSNRTISFYPHSDNDFYIDVLLAGNYELGKVSTKQKYTGHSLKLKFQSKELLKALPFSWVSPNNYSDPDAGWTNETAAYDEDITTHADATAPDSDYTKYLYLDFNEILANKIRYRCNSTYSANITIDVYDGTTWTNVVSTAVLAGSWNEVSFTAQKVQQIRVQFQDTAAVGDNPVNFHEVDLGIF